MLNTVQCGFPSAIAQQALDIVMPKEIIVAIHRQSFEPGQVGNQKPKIGRPIGGEARSSTQTNDPIGLIQNPPTSNRGNRQNS